MRAVYVLLAFAAVAPLVAAALFSEVKVENLIKKARRNPELSGADILEGAVQARRAYMTYML